MASKGFIELLKLDDRGLTRAKDLANKTESLWSGVAFRVGGISLVAPLGEVSEVVSILDLTSVPKVQPWLKGVANLRGRLLPLIHLADFSGVERKSTGLDTSKIVVVDQPKSFSGIIVEQVYGIQHFSENQYVGSELNVNEGINQFLRGYFRKEDDTIWHVFMLSQLIKNEKYQDVML